MSNLYLLPPKPKAAVPEIRTAEQAQVICSVLRAYLLSTPDGSMRRSLGLMIDAVEHTIVGGFPPDLTDKKSNESK